MPFKSEKQRKWMHANEPEMAKKWEKEEESVDEAKKRDYKAEYKKYGKSKKAKKYRAELNKYNRQKGTYGNGDKKDASHKGGKIVGFEEQSKNRGRREKSRLKKEQKITERNEGYFKSLLTRMIDDFDRAEKTWKTTDQKKNKQIWSYLKKGKTNLQFAKDEFLGEGKLKEAMPYPTQPNELSNTMQVIKQVVDSKSYQKYGGTLIDLSVLIAIL